MKEKSKQFLKENNEVLVRILGQDIPGNKTTYSGLTMIKGISWAISNAIHYKLGMSRSRKISDLSKEDIAKIEESLSDFDVPSFIKNRQSDPMTGETSHLLGIKLEMIHEFDIKRLKQIKSYKGNRHALKLPVRGQRTRSNFRKSGIAMGVKKKKK